MLKLIYSKKATKFCEISTVDLSYVVPVKSSVEISKNFVAFSEYMNFTFVKNNWGEKKRIALCGSMKGTISYRSGSVMLMKDLIMLTGYPQKWHHDKQSFAFSRPFEAIVL